MGRVPLPGRIFALLITVSGLALMVIAALRLPWGEYWTYVVWLVILFVAIGNVLSSVVLPDGDRDIGVSVVAPIWQASVVLLPPVGVPLGAAWAAPRPPAWRLRFFNIGMTAIMGSAAAWTYHALGGVLLSTGTVHNWVTQVLLPYLAASIVAETANAVIMIVSISLEEGVSPRRVWSGSMSQSALPMFAYSVFGLMLAAVWSYVGPIATVLVLAPLLVSRWVFAEFAVRREAYERTMQSLIKAVETKDYYTRGHSERVSKASVLIGRRTGMREERVFTLRYAGMLHDVGKLGVPTEVLQASGKLTDEQYEAIQLHPVRGREITKDLEFLGEAIEAIHLHHERIDGRGYPLGLKGSEIPEFARIIAVADAFDSMTTTRSYRGARSVEDAIDELRRCKGSQFDPVMVEALVDSVMADGWELVDTSTPPEGVTPSQAIDDDDPTVASTLGIVIPMAVPRDASSLDQTDRVDD